MGPSPTWREGFKGYGRPSRRSAIQCPIGRSSAIFQRRWVIPWDIKALLRSWRRLPLWYPSMPESVIPIWRKAESNGLQGMDGKEDSYLSNIKDQRSSPITDILYG